MKTSHEAQKPAEEAQLQHMQQAGKLHSVTEEHRARSFLIAKSRQLSVVLEPEPAEHLDHDRRQDHEADHHREPGEISATVKFCGHPHVRAPVQQEGTHSDHGENKVEPRIFTKTRALHGCLTRVSLVEATCCCYANIRLISCTVILPSCPFTFFNPLLKK